MLVLAGSAFEDTVKDYAPSQGIASLESHIAESLHAEMAGTTPGGERKGEKRTICLKYHDGEGEGADRGEQLRPAVT